MMNTLISILSTIIGYLPTLAANGGVFATIITWVIAVSGSLAGLVTAMNLVWQGVVKVLQALSLIPGLSGLGNVATLLSVDQQALENWENSYLIPVLNTLSTLVPVPTANKSQIKGQ